MSIGRKETKRYVRSVILPKWFIVLDTHPYAFAELRLADIPYCTPFAQASFGGLDFATRTNGYVDRGECLFLNNLFLRCKSSNFVPLLVRKNSVWGLLFNVSFETELLDTPCRSAYSLSVNSNLSTCVTSVSCPVKEADGFASSIYGYKIIGRHASLIIRATNL